MVRRSFLSDEEGSRKSERQHGEDETKKLTVREIMFGEDAEPEQVETENSENDVNTGEGNVRWENLGGEYEGNESESTPEKIEETTQPDIPENLGGNYPPDDNTMAEGTITGYVPAFISTETSAGKQAEEEPPARKKVILEKDPVIDDVEETKDEMPENETDTPGMESDATEIEENADPPGTEAEQETEPPMMTGDMYGSEAEQEIEACENDIEDETVTEATISETTTADVTESGGKTVSLEKKEKTLRFGFEEREQRARMKVIGVGGAGANAVDNMIESNLQGVDFITVNTDMQALEASLSPRKVQIGKELTKGLGAGGDPRIGRESAEESLNNMRDMLDGSDMVFITAGMGGGTGTGAAPVIAALAREAGILTVGIVTRPFAFEGRKRLNRALEGLREMREAVDALIVIPNDRIMEIIDEKASFKEAFRKADEVLYQGTKGISDIINTHGFINLDFADAKAVMSNSGDAIMGLGMAEGENRAAEAAEAAITSPLLDNLSIEGAKGILINVTGSEEMSMVEVQKAVDLVTKRAGEDADVYFGIVNDPSLGDKVSVTVIATGFSHNEALGQPIRPVEEVVSTDSGFSRRTTRTTSFRRGLGGDKGNGYGNGNGNGNGNGHSNGNDGSDEKPHFQPVEASDENFFPDIVSDNKFEIPTFMRKGKPRGK